MGVVGDGCSWWSVEGGDAEGMMMAARKTVPTSGLYHYAYNDIGFSTTF